MDAGAVLNPFQIDHVGGEVERGVSGDVVLCIGHEVRPCRPSQTAVMNRLWLNRRMVKNSAPSLQKRSDIIGEPERRENRAHRSCESGSEVILRDHERDLFRHSVVSPDLKNVFHQLRLGVQRIPRDRAWFEGIVFEGHESQIG